MTDDELSAPLGQDRRPRQPRGGLSFLQMAAAALGALTITFLGWAVLVEDPLGGEPVAMAPVDLAAVSKDRVEKPGPASSGPRTEPSRDTDDGAVNEPPAVTLPPGRTVTIIDGTSGQRRELVIPAPAGGGNGDSVEPAAARPARLRHQ